MFLGINIFWTLLRAHFNPRLKARAKMSLSRAQNIFMPANINSFVLLVSKWSDQQGNHERDINLVCDCMAKYTMFAIYVKIKEIDIFSTAMR